MVARFIAQRYLFSRRLPAAVHILSWISIVGIALATASLVLVLSVFNGFHDVLQNLFANVDPSLRIVAVQGRYLPSGDSILQNVRLNPEVDLALPTLSGRAIISYAGNQTIVQLTGVPDEYAKLTQIAAQVHHGEFRLTDSDSFPALVMGAGAAIRAGINLLDQFEPIRVFTVTGQANLLSAPEQAVREVRAYPAGVFSIHKEYDDELVYAPISLAQELFADTLHYSTVDIRLREGVNTEAVRRRLQAQLGPSVAVQSWYGQHQTLFLVLRNEKAVGYLVLTLMIVLAASTIVGTLTMLAMDKQADLALLRATGASRRTIQAVFLWQGLLTGGLAATAGLLLGAGIAWLQQTFGLLRMAGGESFLVEAFPVQMQLADFVLIFATVTSLALLSSAVPAWRASQGTIAQRFRA